MTLKSHSLLSLVGSSVDSLTGSVLGGVLHVLSFVGCSVGSVLGSTLNGVTCSTYG